MIPTRAGTLTYKLICIPNTQELEQKVQEALKENADKILVGESFTAAPYTNRDGSGKGNFYIKELWFVDSEHLKK